MHFLIVPLKVDLIRTVTLPHLEPFGISDGLELKVSGSCVLAQLMFMLALIPRSGNGAHLR